MDEYPVEEWPYKVWDPEKKKYYPVRGRRYVKLIRSNGKVITKEVEKRET